MGTRYFTLTNPIVVPMGETRQWQFEDMVVDETATYYADNFEYTLYKDPDPHTQSDWISLTRIHNVEGYVSRVPLAASATNQPTYCYYRKDHLGNNREVWQAPVEGKDKTTAASTIQRTQYYPSGLPFGSLVGDGPERQPYKYNGKEFITMHGYDMYDYGMRGYYAAIMRFTTPDPLAEKYYSVSPYAYCGNNPVNRVDPDGMAWVQDEDGNIIWKAEYNETNLPKGYKYIGTEYTIGNTKYIQKANDKGEVGLYASKADDKKSDKASTQDATFAPAIPWYAAAGEIIETSTLRMTGGILSLLFLSGDTDPHRDNLVAIDAYHPPPNELPGLPGSVKDKLRAGRIRWKLPDGDIGGWNSQHGEVEVYDKTGKKNTRMLMILIQAKKRKIVIQRERQINKQL